MKKKSLPTGWRPVFLALAAFLIYSCSAKAQDTPASDMTKAFADAGVPLLKETVSIRDFSLPLAEPLSPGGTQSLSALKGRVVFLNFWATWCGPCRSEMPSMESLHNRYSERGLEILAVNSGENTPEVLAFMKDNKLSFPTVLDMDGKVTMTYGVQAIPTSFIINREGRIIARKVGSIDWDSPKVRAALEILLSE